MKSHSEQLEDIRHFLETVKKSNHALSDKYSRIYDRWIDEDNAARLLEDMRSTELEERKHALILEALPKGEKLADNAAERQVKASAEWREREESTIAARTRANILKGALTVTNMRFMEQQSHEATERAKVRL